MESKEDAHDYSEEENNVNLLNTKKQNKYKIVDSDSEPELSESLENKITENHIFKPTVDENPSNNPDGQENILTKRPLCNRNCINSDESDDEISPHNKSFPNEETAEAIIYTTDSSGKFVAEDAVFTHSVQKSLSTLCDADSSDEEVTKLDNEDIIDESIVQPKVYKPPRKRTKNDTAEKMTAKEAAKQRLEIQSESQRMVRELNVSLPYHKPKSYTIREFLQKRSKLASTTPLIPKAPPSVAIKMSKEKLVEISKTLDERIKQVEKFYKSESEDEENEETEIVKEEIRSWLDVLVDSAMDCADKEVEAEVNDYIENENKKNINEASQDVPIDYEIDLGEEKEKSSRRLNFSNFFQEELLNVQPKLSGGPDDVIDLESGVAKPSEVMKLVEKYFQHTVRKAQSKYKVKLDVIGLRKGQIVKETVSMNVDEEEEPVLVETPGAKLQKLREELQNQIVQRRSELWKLKQEQGDILSTEKAETVELGDCGGKKDILDDDEEEEIEMTESEYEDEEEEDDVYLKPEKRKPKSAFIEDEADEDEIEDDGNPGSNDEEIFDDNREHVEEQEENDNDGFDGDDEEPPEIITSETSKKKILKRIVQPFTEDSDDDDDYDESFPIRVPVSKPVNKSLDSTASADDLIPPNLPRTDKTPQRPHLDNKSEFDFLTPVTYLTGLQNLASDPRFARESPIISPFRTPLGISPLKETQDSPNVHQKLFLERSHLTQDTQDNVDELANMCSGNFPETQSSSTQQEILNNVPSTQELLNICSGAFSGDFSNSVPDDNFSKVQSEDRVIINIETNVEKEIKSLGDDNGQIISQLLDEDELERFKKKFESPVISTSQSKVQIHEPEEVNATGLINSDEENEELEIRRKKGQKKLVFSDDEDTSDQDEEFDEENDERIDLHDLDDEEQLLEDEIVAKESGIIQTSDFFEHEAELSESDWGSADEDEKGLDEFEFEQGDEEAINEDKVRSELERIHMRQVLDQDNREVKILQELLLEDGEMHGSGRQRQFKWRALDSVETSEFEKREDDNIFLDEEESEEHWRKMRHQREMFLKKKVESQSDDLDNILSNSQILNAASKLKIQDSQSFGSQSSTTPETADPIEEETFSLLSKRGSFLNRNEQILQRINEYNKATEGVVGNATKNSKCFIFQSVEETDETTTVRLNNNNKRKASDATPKAIKKLRLSNLSPALNRKQSTKPIEFKKLF